MRAGGRGLKPLCGIYAFLRLFYLKAKNPISVKKIKMAQNRLRSGFQTFKPSSASKRGPLFCNSQAPAVAGEPLEKPLPPEKEPCNARLKSQRSARKREKGQSQLKRAGIRDGQTFKILGGFEAKAGGLRLGSGKGASAWPRAPYAPAFSIQLKRLHALFASGGNP